MPESSNICGVCNGAGAEDHFARGPHFVLPALALIDHADRAAILHDDPQHQCLGVAA